MISLHNVVIFDQLGRIDKLIVNTLYKGGSKGNITDDAISKLMPCGNQGGFRIVGHHDQVRFVVLYSNLNDPDWPDVLDLTNGSFLFYGDNKSHGKDLHSTRGNMLLRNVFNNLHSGNRKKIPPFFIFTKGYQGRDVVFRGLAAPGPALDQEHDLLAFWKGESGGRFLNYRARFTILDIMKIPCCWVGQLKVGELLGSHCPEVWYNWVQSGEYSPMRTNCTDLRSLAVGLSYNTNGKL